MAQRPSLTEALDAVMRAILDRNPGLAPSISVIADHIASLARSHTKDDPTAPSASANPEAKTGEPVPARAAPSLAPPPHPPGMHATISAVPSAPARIVEHRPVAPLSAGYVPLRMPDGTIKQMRVEGTGADIAAARFSASESVRSEGEEIDTRRYQPPDLELIASRCDLKILACKAAIDRRAATNTAQELDEIRNINELINQGKQLDNCYLWMLNRAKPQATDEALRLISWAYSNLAAAARLCLRITKDAPVDRRTRALHLLAEAQSALRIALQPTWLTMPDKDQDDAFRYLNESTSYEQIFIGRYMKLGDPADPAAWQDLQARLGGIVRELDDAEAGAKKDKAVFSRIKHHAKLIAAAPTEDHHHDWTKIEDAVAKLADSRGRAADLVDLLRPVASIVPAGEQYPAIGRVLAALRPKAELEEEPEPEGGKYSESVARVRDMLRGARLVIVGGERREDAVARIRDAFELAEVDWIALPEHSSSSPAEAPIRRADTRLVLVLIRLAGHLHVEDIAMFCERHGKPLIRLPAGYNPERIAAEVLGQASGKLEAKVRLG